MTDLLAGYLARIAADLPALRVASARMNSDGMMNDVVVVNDTQVFRFAKNEHAKTLLAYEAQLLQLIERSVTVPVPRIEHCNDTYMHYRFVPGTPLYRHTLLRADTATQDLLAHQLAMFLQQLHAIPLSDLPAQFPACDLCFEFPAEHFVVRARLCSDRAGIWNLRIVGRARCPRTDF